MLSTLPHFAGVSRLDTLSPALPLSITNLPHHKNDVTKNMKEGGKKGKVRRDEGKRRQVHVKVMLRFVMTVMTTVRLGSILQ